MRAYLLGLWWHSNDTADAWFCMQTNSRVGSRVYALQAPAVARFIQ